MRRCQPVRKRYEGGDEVCFLCGQSWEPWDETPVCTAPNRRERTKAIADRELQKMRAILRGQ